MRLKWTISAAALLLTTTSQLVFPVAATGLVQSGVSIGTCSETTASFICETPGDGGTQLSFDDTCSERQGNLQILRHSGYRNGLSQEVTCSTDTGKVVIPNVTISSTMNCSNPVEGTMEQCYIAYINTVLYPSNTCRILTCEVVIDGTTYPFGNASVGNKPPSPSDVNATLTLQGTTTMANLTWKQVTDNCTDDVTLKYRLTTNNCGSCSSSMDTDDNMIICDGIGPGDQCNISIQSVTPCNAVSVPTKLSITGLAPDSEGTETPQPKLTDSDIRAIIGGVVGGVVALSIAILTVVACTYCIRRKKNKGASRTFSNRGVGGRNSKEETVKSKNSVVAQETQEAVRWSPNSHETRTAPLPMPNEGGPVAFNQATEGTQATSSDYHRRSKKCSGPIPVSDDIVTSQTVGINDLGKAPSPVPVVKIGDDGLDKRLIAIEMKQKEQDSKQKENEAKFHEHDVTIGSLTEKVSRLTEELADLHSEYKELQEKKQESDEEVERLKSLMAEKEKELQRTKTKLKIMEDEVLRGASKRESGMSYTSMSQTI